MKRFRDKSNQGFLMVKSSTEKVKKLINKTQNNCYKRCQKPISFYFA